MCNRDELIFSFIFCRVITESCRDTDDTDEFIMEEIEEFELAYTSSSEDLYTSGSSSGTDVMQKKKKIPILIVFQKINGQNPKKKKL